MTRTTFARVLIALAVFTLLAFASQTQVGATEPGPEPIQLCAPVCSAPDGPPSCDTSPEVRDECKALASPLISEAESSQQCFEDDPCWDCTTMGNQVCGPIATLAPNAYPDVPGDTPGGGVLLPDTATPANEGELLIALGLFALALATLISAERTLRQR